jgi:hypothetical protein
LKSEIKTNHELRKKKKKQVNWNEALKPELIFKIQNCEILNLSSIKKLDFPIILMLKDEIEKQLI